MTTSMCPGRGILVQGKDACCRPFCTEETEFAHPVAGASIVCIKYYALVGIRAALQSRPIHSLEKAERHIPQPQSHSRHPMKQLKDFPKIPYKYNVKHRELVDLLEHDASRSYLYVDKLPYFDTGGGVNAIVAKLLCGRKEK